MNERRMALMRIMDANKKFTARELAEQFQVSLRTIQRDLDYLQTLGFPLYTEVGAHGGYRVLPNRILPPLQLNVQEAFALFLMLAYLEQVPDFPYGSLRAHLAEQYYAGLPKDVQERISRARDHVRFSYASRPVHEEPLTTPIVEAAIEKRELHFQYESSKGVKRVQAYPLGVYMERGYWYMPAKRGERVLLYRVDRMSEVVHGQKVDVELPTLTEWLAAPDERVSEKVVLHFTEFGLRMAASDPLYQSVEPTGYWRGGVPSEEFPYTARRLLAYGPEVKVLEPQELRELVVELLERSRGRYLKDEKADVMGWRQPPDK